MEAKPEEECEEKLERVTQKLSAPLIDSPELRSERQKSPIVLLNTDLFESGKRNLRGEQSITSLHFTRKDPKPVKPSKLNPVGSHPIIF